MEDEGTRVGQKALRATKIGLAERRCAGVRVEGGSKGTSMRGLGHQGHAWQVRGDEGLGLGV